MLDELIAKLTALPDDQQDQLKRETVEATRRLKFIPNPGPQTEAYLSQADILLYGGQAGGGKSMLELGLAVNEHQRSIIFRRESSQTDGLEAEGKKIIAESARYNGVDREWSWVDGRSLKLAGMKEADDWMKYAGRERDLIEFDEAAEFLEVQIRSLLAWNRGPVGQRCRMILGSNPPRTDEGLWIVKWFAPWLDKTHPNPANPGELRWAIFVDEKIEWKDAPGKTIINGEEYTHYSLTFIPAALKDNPYRNTDEYRAKLQSLPEPLRSQLLHGDFTAGVKDADFQLIPTAWIIAAQNRWSPAPPKGMAMTAQALDPAGGGRDSAELINRYGWWFSELISAQGEETADGSATAATIVKYRRDACPVVIDVGGGYGGQVMMRLKDNGINASGFNGARRSTGKTKDKQLAFANKRAEAWWRAREELDPDQEGGSVVALPPDPELRADLAAPTWKLTARGIVIESKEDIRTRLGRSPGKGDVVAMALAEGDRVVMRSRGNSGSQLKVIMGHEHQRRIRH